MENNKSVYKYMLLFLIYGKLRTCTSECRTHDKYV